MALKDRLDFQTSAARNGDMSRRKRSTRRGSMCGLILRKGVWHIEGEASFAFRAAVKPSVAAADKTSCLVRPGKQMERFTVVRNTCSKRSCSTSYRVIA
jgi:hypothetical protein